RSSRGVTRTSEGSSRACSAPSTAAARCRARCRPASTSRARSRCRRAPRRSTPTRSPRRWRNGMARGTSLGNMLEALRLELRRSSNVAISQDDAPHLRRVLARVYEQLYDEHDWPQLRKSFRKSLAATQRYYDFPTGLNPERVETAHVWY